METRKSMHTQIRTQHPDIGILRNDLDASDLNQYFMDLQEEYNK